MPMFEYHCNACGKDFEEIAGSEATVPCPGCGSDDTARQMSAPSLKTGAPPFKVGPVRPMPPSRPGGGCPGGSCGGCGGSTTLG
ncbi:FmdB family zinc ribbon protein [Nitratidesulfovibrio vulgaris]|uniref:FmdB family zinc ribbon protein n=1 Tax=Nitratidesulfovibrio vulgaris TaxID=881 RepID=UPI0001ECFE14|nr:zinc ribbon domain-containing protein [Nitratidesulfovibrio vulgaris]ADP86083.1 regulatory protein, FmdB family [Nitratidesulfovibrio vulgaris RCH1]WCB47636.1 zinc ribbon domain-containing protein [Nitratidesulfovibrio vulgaris]HBW15269.1 zinc ribbon domain-containing protein [Desulfovibrio sp.]